MTSKPRSWAAIAGLVYGGCGLLQYRGVLARLNSSVFGGNDGMLFTWWIGWLPHAIATAIDPLVTKVINIPAGANAMWNTSVLLLAALAAPVTVIFGPVASTNLLYIAGPAASALCAFLVLRRYVESDAAALVGGLLYGFSPVFTGVHLHTMWAVFPPLVVLFIDEALVRQQRSPAVLGLIVGVACVAQFLVSAEMLAIGAVAAATSGLVLCALHPREIKARASYVLRVLAWSVGVFGVLGGWPLYVMLFGPLRTQGLVQMPGRYVTDLVELVVPGPHQMLAPRVARRSYHTFTGNASEHTGYLGLPLIILLASSAARHWRRPIVRVTTCTGVLVAVLSLGPWLTIGGTAHRSIHLPWTLIQDMPLVRNILPARMSVYVVMCAATLLTLETDALISSRRDRRWPARCVLVLVALAAIIPSSRRPTDIPATPALFSSESSQIPEGSRLVVEPYPNPRNAIAMLWQAQARMRFAMPGGYLLTDLTGRDPRFVPLETLTFNLSAFVQSGRPLVIDEVTRRLFVAELQALGVCAVVVGSQPFREPMLTFLQHALRQRGVSLAGTTVFRVAGCGGGRSWPPVSERPD